MSRPFGTVALALLFSAAPLCSQQAPPAHPHQPGMQHTASPSEAPSVAPSSPGQAAFGAIAEVVRILEADSATAWDAVDLEALRQHLLDMDLVTLRARVAQTRVEGGSSLEVTGDDQTAAAIRRMVAAHTRVLDGMGPWRAVALEIPGGVRLVVTARDPADERSAAKIRGLGFIGLVALGDHHPEHHLAIARGGSGHAHEPG